METVLVGHLFDLMEAYRKATNLGEATVGRFCAADGRFFTRLRDGKTFTARKYDEVVLWFASNWPEAAEWPAEIERPTSPDLVEKPATVAQSGAAA